MSEAVLNSSVILAMVQEEPVSNDYYLKVLGGIISAVNVAEICGKAAEWNTSPAKVDRVLSMLGRVESLTARQAKIAGELRRTTSVAGLSLGDRCCIALALELGTEVYTMDRAWLKCDVGCKVHLLR